MQLFSWNLLYKAHLISPILFIAFLSLVLARRLSSTCSVISPTISPFMVLRTPYLPGHVLCKDNLVIEVQSAFFFCGHFTDYENTFKRIGEPNYTVELIANADIGVLLLKDWFKWANESKPPAAGTHLIFHLHSEVTYKNKVNYCSDWLGCCCWQCLSP